MVDYLAYDKVVDAWNVNARKRDDFYAIPAGFGNPYPGCNQGVSRPDNVHQGPKVALGDLVAGNYVPPFHVVHKSMAHHRGQRPSRKYPNATLHFSLFS